MTTWNLRAIIVEAIFVYFLIKYQFASLLWKEGPKQFWLPIPHFNLKEKNICLICRMPFRSNDEWFQQTKLFRTTFSFAKKRLRQSHCVNNIWSRVWGQTEINHVHHPWKMKGSCIKEKSQLGLTSEKCWYPACSNIAVQLSESFHTNPAKTIS